MLFASKISVSFKQINSGRFVMVFIETELKLNIKHNENTACYPYGETCYINKGIPFVPLEISQGNY